MVFSIVFQHDCVVELSFFCVLEASARASQSKSFSLSKIFNKANYISNLTSFGYLRDSITKDFQEQNISTLIIDS